MDDQDGVADYIMLERFQPFGYSWNDREWLKQVWIRSDANDAISLFGVGRSVLSPLTHFLEVPFARYATVSAQMKVFVVALVS